MHKSVFDSRISSLVYSTGVARLDDLLAGGLRRGLYCIRGYQESGTARLMDMICEANPGLHVRLPGVRSHDVMQLIGRVVDLKYPIILMDSFECDADRLIARKLSQMSMDRNSVIVIATRPASDEMTEKSIYLHSNGIWVLDAVSLSVVKERYGDGKYADNGGRIPWSAPEPRC